MPKLKTVDPAFIAVARLLRGYGIKASTLAAAIGCSYPTAKKKLEEPQYLTLSDLSLCSKHFSIPIEEIRNAITR